MTKTAKPKAKASREPKRPTPAGNWGEAMKKALKEKRPGGGPAQPKPRDSGKFKVRKDSI